MRIMFNGSIPKGIESRLSYWIGKNTKIQEASQKGLKDVLWREVNYRFFEEASQKGLKDNDSVTKTIIPYYRSIPKGIERVNDLLNYMEGVIGSIPKGIESRYEDYTHVRPPTSGSIPKGIERSVYHDVLIAKWQKHPKRDWKSINAFVVIAKYIWSIPKGIESRNIFLWILRLVKHPKRDWKSLLQHIAFASAAFSKHPKRDWKIIPQPISIVLPFLKHPKRDWKESNCRGLYLGWGEASQKGLKDIPYV